MNLVALNGNLVTNGGNPLVTGDGVVALPSDIGCIDLGTLTPIIYNTNCYRYSEADIPNCYVPSGASDMILCTCSKYLYRNNATDVVNGTLDGCFGGFNGYYGTYIYFHDTNLVGKTVAEIKSAMSGVLLFYKKATT